MTDQTTTDPNDIAYLKRLAVAGRGEPAPFLLLMAVFGGAYGLWALIVCLAVLISFILGQAQLGMGAAVQQLSAWMFGAAHLAFMSALAWTLWRTFGPRRIAVSRAAAAIWSAAFAGLLAVIGAVFAGADPSHAAFNAGSLSSVLLILWGCAWWATAITSDRRWLLFVSAGSFLASIALQAVGPGLWGMPILTACLILLAFAPAVVLMRRRKA